MENTQGIHRKKKHGLLKGLIAFIVVIALVVGGAYAFWTLPQTQQTKEELLVELQSQDYAVVDGVMDLIAAHTQQDSIDQLEQTIQQGIDAHQTTINLGPLNRFTEDEASAALLEVLTRPENFFTADDYTYTIKTTDRYQYVYQAKVNYWYSAEETTQKKAELETAVADALSWVTDDMSDAQIAQALHDYLVRNCRYGGEDLGRSTNAYDCLVTHLATCQGYSLAYELLLTRAGVPCISVLSESMDHGWNMVQLDGQWYHVDVTWDDPLVNGSDQGYWADVCHDYFLKSDATMEHAGHYGWDTALEAPEDYAVGWYRTYS